MEKIRLIVILLLAFSGTYAQSWVTGISFDYTNSSPAWDSTSKHNVPVDFPNLKYDETFEIRLKGLKSSGYHVGFKNHFVFNKNVVVTDIGVGLNFYKYQFNLTKKDYTSSLDTTINGDGLSDSLVWQHYQDNNNEDFNIVGAFPSIRLHIGYKRELLKYKNLSLYGDAGIIGQRRFSFFQDYSKNIGDNTEPIWINFRNLLSQRMFISSVYVGFSMRYNSHLFGIKLGNNLGPTTRKIAALTINESFALISYSKLFSESHLGKEQIIYDEYQHLSQTRSSEFRRGDKYSYFQFGSIHENRAIYQNYTPSESWFVDNGDSTKILTEGYNLRPNLGFELMLNSYFTHRWMAGLGFGMYQETYYSYGDIVNEGTETSFGNEHITSSPDNSYQEYWNKNKVTVALNTAIYPSKRIMKIDPYVKGSASMVMGYDAPTFLAVDPSWKAKSFFPIIKVGAGVDIRLRLKSSKYFVLGTGIDYNINPHVNYAQYYFRVGYYRKKKLKNQTY